MDVNELYRLIAVIVEDNARIVQETINAYADADLMLAVMAGRDARLRLARQFANAIAERDSDFNKDRFLLACLDRESHNEMEKI
jgi:hypothetical protein